MKMKAKIAVAAERQKARDYFAAAYGQLNERQREAVDTIDGPVMVLAGPGTGKTQVLAVRIAKILQETQMSPSNILCLTFTDSGVASMRKRLLKIMGTAGYYVRVHTFHSFCNDVIRDHPELFAAGGDWQMLTDIERLDIMQSLLDGLSVSNPLKPLGYPYTFLGDIAKNIQDLKQEDISPAELAGVLRKIEGFVKKTKEKADSFFDMVPSSRTWQHCEQINIFLQEKVREEEVPQAWLKILDDMHVALEEKSQAAENKRSAGKAVTAYKNDLKKWWLAVEKNLPKQMEMQRLYRSYIKELEKRGRYDYADMIALVVDEFKNNDELLAEYQEQFQYILVDEYQDTNGAQNEVVAMLGSFDEQPNIFVVGDDKQSIYRFQGASLNNMLEFYQKYREHVKVVTLENNYRSQETVLQAAAGVIQNNQEQIGKYINGTGGQLVPAAGRAREQLVVCKFNTEEDEDVYTAGQVKKLLADGTAPEEIAILFRQRQDGRSLWEALRRMDVPARLEEGEEVLADRLVNQLVQLIELLAYPERDDLLAAALQFAWLGVNDLDALKIIRGAALEHEDLLGLLVDKNSLEKLGVRDTKAVGEFAGRLAAWRRSGTGEILPHWLVTVLDESGWLAHAFSGSEDGSLHKMVRLLGEAKSLSATNREAGGREFVERLRNLQQHKLPLMVEAWRSDGGAVRLMTAHKAKGMEFEYVFVSRLNDKHWGNLSGRSRVKLPHGLVKYDYVAGQERNEDERRLFYVALTRAKQGVRLTRAVHSMSGRETVPSIFLNEIPEQLLDSKDETMVAASQTDSNRLRPVRALSGELEAWLKSVLASYAMSVTHLNNYLECPRKFYVKNILRVPDVRTVYQAMGTAVHYALAKMYWHWQETNVLPAADEIEKFFDWRLSKELLTTVDLKDAQETGRKILADYLAQNGSSLKKEVLVEYDFRSHRVNVDGVPITGKLDKIELLDAREVNVVDYKTGNPKKGLAKLKEGKDYRRQIVFYKLLGDESQKFNYEMVSGEIDFLQPDDKGKLYKKKITVSTEEIEELREIIKQVWQEIQNLNFVTGKERPFCGKRDCEYCRNSI
ncbi:MAG: ATP-dependent DNA helicase [Candidatus Andersenbacteria bacterium]|nr:ATP-dependent DNA helicase [Candidatus Andersenbacteria bacterium]